MTVFELRLPDLGEGIAEGTVDEWFVSPGDQVKEDQPLVEVTTDKATVEIPSPVAGRLRQVLIEPGSTVAVGTLLAEIETEQSLLAAGDPRSGEGPFEEAMQQGQANPRQRSEEVPPHGADRTGRTERVQATPGARRLAKELGVDLVELAGRLPGRALREDDVRAASLGSQGAVAHPDAQQRPAIQPRRTITERLTKAAGVPTVTNVDEADFEAVMASGISPLVALCSVVVSCLAGHPKLNAWNQDGELVEKDRVNLGIATQTQAGLVVPVILDAGSMGLEELSAAISDVAKRAKEGRLRPEELSGSTFTVTSAGKLAGLWSTPLLNLPEVAILGLYRIEARAVVTEKGIQARRRANLSITFDHRVLDGMDAASFLASVKQGLEAFGPQQGTEDGSQAGPAGPFGD
jgi:pyruvate/2-oxoglutarate dehydrogenase complex dihydrolipoamide acyltransferase (E2) component